MFRKRLISVSKTTNFYRQLSRNYSLEILSRFPEQYSSLQFSIVPFQLLGYSRNHCVDVSANSDNCKKENVEEKDSYDEVSDLTGNKLFNDLKSFVYDTKLNNIWNGIWLSSTMKKRRSKMNKHKLRKRRKKLRFNTKSSRR